MEDNNIENRSFWNKVYAAVLLFLVAEIIVFTLLSNALALTQSTGSYLEERSLRSLLTAHGAPQGRAT